MAEDTSIPVGTSLRQQYREHVAAEKRRKEEKEQADRLRREKEQQQFEEAVKADIPKAVQMIINYCVDRMKEGSVTFNAGNDRCVALSEKSDTLIAAVTKHHEEVKQALIHAGFLVTCKRTEVGRVQIQDGVNADGYPDYKYGGVIYGIEYEISWK